ncbi:MAG: TVP38/TMEM64 family protein [Lysobacterales bacterium CG02_land_8_20_14_3_00_62_12]|nr:MAG: TVP38/TMEM64 family protein [Xanthomonadales bacterium CG02_land_8_20_14_3_00_62_12]
MRFDFARHWRWLILLLLIGVIFTLWQSGLLRELNLTELQSRRLELRAWTLAHPGLAAAEFFALYVLITASSLPGAAILTLAAGAMFGLLEGSLLASFASSVGASLAFLSSRFLLRDGLRSRYGERIKHFDAGIEKDCAYYLLSMRLVPAIPFFLVNLLSGLTPMKLGKFYLVSQIGMLPGTLVFVYAGTQLAAIKSLGDVLSPGLLAAFVLLGLLPITLRLLGRWLATRRAA